MCAGEPIGVGRGRRRRLQEWTDAASRAHRDASVTDIPTVATIVVTYNSAATIGRSLQCIASSTVPSEVWVVDNASTDGTVDVVGTHPSVQLVRNSRNLGFAAACNVGMAAAADRSPTYLLLVNPDAYLDPACLAALLDALGCDPQAAMASPLVLDAASDAIWYAGARAEVQTGTYWHIGVGEHDHGQYTGTVVTGRPTGCVLLVRRDVVDTVGPMDPSYFLYWEDVEWSLRCTARGLHTLFVGGARAHHDVSSTTGGAASKVYEYYYLRNRLRLVHETSRMTRGQLVAANLRGSASSIGGAFGAGGLPAGLQTTRAIVLAYADFLRDHYGWCERL